MEKIWHKKKKTRILLIIIANVMVISMMLGVMSIMSYAELFDDLITGKLTQSYEDSYDFDTELMNSAYQVMSGIDSEQMFETDGKIDEDKLVDIQVYNNSETISGQNESGLSYRLGDLLNWYQKLIYSESTSYVGDTLTDSAELEGDDAEDLKAPIVCKLSDGSYHYYSQDDFNEKVLNGELKFVMTDGIGAETSEQILDELENVDISDRNEMTEEEKNFRGIVDAEGTVLYVDCWKYDGVLFREEAAQLEAENLLQIVNENSNWNGRLNEAYNMLESCIYQIGDRYANYESLTEQYKEGDSNFFYYYLDLKSGKVVTNREELGQENNINDVAKSVRKMGKYVIIKSKLSEFETNIQEADAELWQSQTVYLSNVDKGEFVFMTGVDTKYPVKDSYYKNAHFYEKYSPFVRGVSAGMILAFLIFFASVVWLVVIAGRTERDGELHLYKFDRCKTEVGAAAVIFAWFVPSLLTVLFMGAAGIISQKTFAVRNGILSYETFFGMIGFGGLAVYTCNMFLVGILSLARRIKAGIAWKNSFLYSVVEFVKLLIRNARHIAKIIVLYLAYAAVHWVAYLASGWPSAFWSFVIFIVQTAGFVILVNWAVGRQKIKEGIEKISEGELDYKIDLEDIHGEQRKIAEQVNSIGSGLDAAVEKNMKSERLKTDLITNVSHDIKTPLTSIINYVNLLKQEKFDDPKIQRYIEVLEEKSQRLKTLTEDVVEASKVSSGNISLEFMNINMIELIQQTSGEFEEKFQARNLTQIMNFPEEDAIVRVDGRRMWRVLANIYNNAAKYAMEGTRIYADLQTLDGKVIFSLKNISEQPLNISSAEELTERFIRGDLSRSTEGSGLGLSIAKTLTTMMGGTFDLYLDGDLFKVVIIFDKID